MCTVSSLAFIKHFYPNFKTIFFVDKFTKEYYKSFGILELFDEVNDTLLDQEVFIDKSIFWAAGKIIAQREIKGPTITLDLDFWIFSDIEKLGKTYQDEIEGMGKKLEAKVKKYQAEQNVQTKEINESRALEVQQENQRYEQLRQTAYQEMQKKQAEGLNPIIEKAQKAIEDVAAAKGIVYVFDSSVGKGLLVSKGEDLFNAVKAKLGF
jgi:outer membrane protein